MAAKFYNHGLYKLLNLATSGSTDLRCLVIAGASLPSGAKNVDLDFVSDVLAVGSVVEAAATNYARQDLAGVTLTENDAGDKVDFTATAPTMNNVAVGETWRMVLYYLEGGGTDATRDLIAYDEPAATLVTNGGNVTLPQFVAAVTSP
jgi:hypothetical protein